LRTGVDIKRGEFCCRLPAPLSPEIHGTHISLRVSHLVFALFCLKSCVTSEKYFSIFLSRHAVYSALG